MYIVHDVVRISAPDPVIRIVCSNCAAGPPSAVKIVHLSGHVTNSVVPMVRIGSARVKVIKEYIMNSFKLYKRMITHQA